MVFMFNALILIAPKRHWQSPPREYYSPERKRGSRITDMRHSPRCVFVCLYAFTTVFV